MAAKNNQVTYNSYNLKVVVTFVLVVDELGVPHHKGISDGKITFPLQQAITC